MSPKTARKKTTRRGKLNGTAAGRKPTRRESFAAKRAANGASAPAAEVHCALAPLAGQAMLLPTNVVAEVIEYTAPQPMADTPDWFLGQVEWENRQVPVFDYGALISGAEPESPGERARIVILKSLTDSARVPFLGMVSRDTPRLMNVQPAELRHVGDERKSMGVFCHVEINEEAAVIPDLERLTHLVTHAAYGALPITQVGG